MSQNDLAIQSLTQLGQCIVKKCPKLAPLELNKEGADPYLQCQPPVATGGSSSPSFHLKPFYILASCVTGTDEIQVKLSSYHGKILQTEVFRKTPPKALVKASHILKSMSSQKVSLCQGHDLSDCKEVLMSSEILLEPLFGEVVVRSRTCQYAIITQEEEDLLGSGRRKSCTECKGLLRNNLHSHDDVLAQAISKAELPDFDPVIVSKSEEEVCEVEILSEEVKEARVELEGAVGSILPIEEEEEEEENVNEDDEEEYANDNDEEMVSFSDDEGFSWPNDAEQQNREETAAATSQEIVVPYDPKIYSTLSPEPDTFHCPICLKEFQAAARVEPHIRSKHLNALELLREDKCTKCDEIVQLKDLNVHNLKRHDRFEGICLVCKKTFASHRLEPHYERVHSALYKARLCFICGKVFR